MPGLLLSMPTVYSKKGAGDVSCIPVNRGFLLTEVPPVCSCEEKISWNEFPVSCYRPSSPPGASLSDRGRRISGKLHSSGFGTVGLVILCFVHDSGWNSCW